MKAIILLKTGTVHIMELNYEMDDIRFPIMPEFMNDKTNGMDYDVYVLTGKTSKGLLIYEFSKSVNHKNTNGLVRL
jgi:hypothetical protein